MDSLFFFAILTLPVMRKEDFSMKKISHVLSNEKLRAVGRFLKESCKVIIPIVGSALLSQTGRYALEQIRYCGNVGYGDAVRAIANSDMFSGDQAKALAVLRRDETSEFYKAVIETARATSMLSGAKRDVIISMCERTE